MNKEVGLDVLQALEAHLGLLRAVPSLPSPELLERLQAMVGNHAGQCMHCSEWLYRVLHVHAHGLHQIKQAPCAGAFAGTLSLHQGTRSQVRSSKPPRDL